MDLIVRVNSVNFRTWIPDCDCRNLALLDFFLSFYASIYSRMGNFDHVVVLVSICFPSNSKRYSPFHRIAYEYCRADWNGLCDHLRDSQEISKLKKKRLVEERLVKLWITLRNISTTYKYIDLVAVKSCWVSTGSESRISGITKKLYFLKKGTFYTCFLFIFKEKNSTLLHFKRGSVRKTAALFFPILLPAAYYPWYHARKM